jgi:hypothetical protein
VLGLGDGGYPALARYVPILPERQWVMGARTSDLLDDGFSLLGTNDHPHWTIVFAEPTAAHFVRARRHFSQSIQGGLFASGWDGRFRFRVQRAGRQVRAVRPHDRAGLWVDLHLAEKAIVSK